VALRCRFELELVTPIIRILRLPLLVAVLCSVELTSLKVVYGEREAVVAGPDLVAGQFDRV